MASIYDRWLEHRRLHRREKHEQRKENSVTDFACRKCYPVKVMREEMRKEFLRFWEILCDIEPQIEEESYTSKTIISFFFHASAGW